jgi:hypothetical protein
MTVRGLEERYPAILSQRYWGQRMGGA